MFKLENDKILLILSDKGLITSFKNKVTGNEYIYPGEDVWRLFLYEGEPGKPKVGTMPYCWEIPVYSKEQKPEIEKEGDNLLKVIYNGVTCVKHDPEKAVRYAECAGLTDRVLNIRLTFTVALKGDETVWKCQIENDENIGVGEIWFPIISATWLSSEKDDYLLLPSGMGQRINKPLEKMKGKRSTMLGFSVAPHMSSELSPFRSLYPGFASMQWFTLCNPREGLYMASYDKSLQTTCINVEKKIDGVREHLMLCFAKYPFIERGEKWESAEFVVSAYVGSWHVAAKKYRSWTDTWMVKPKPPKWVRQMNGWQWNSLKWQNGVIRWTYKDIPKLYEDAKLGGLDSIWLVGWSHAGNDREYPDYPYNLDPRLGTEEELKKSLEQVKKDGGNIWLYNNGRLVDPLTEWYKKIGHKVTMKTIWGNEYIDTWTYWEHGSLMDLSNNYHVTIACPSTDEWYKVLLGYAKRSRYLGSKAVFYDFWVHLFPYLCFDKTHLHEKPAYAYGPGVVSILKRVREEMTREDPDFAFSAEGIGDAAGQYIDFFQGAGSGFQPGPEDFPEMFRYTFPEYIVSNRVIEIEDYYRLNFAFVYGFRFDFEFNFTRGTFKDSPKLAAYSKRLCEIRKKHADLLLEGRFVDDEGFTIDNPRIVAKAFKNDDKLAVLVWNPQKNAEKFQIKVSKEYRLEVVESIQGESKKVPEEIQANSIMALIYKKTGQ
jgi:hypothetical protein